MEINPIPELSKVGGKAHQLHRLAEWCNVPPFFTIAFHDPHEIDDPSAQRMILHECIRRQFKVMAVRSSASLEDSAQASFAGIFETMLNVREHNLIDAIRRVLASVGAGRVAEYCRAHGLNNTDIRMAVIVQVMVRSRVSGVCVTRLSAGGDSLIVEACFGLGEALVSGKVSPDRYVVDRTTLGLRSQSIGYQTALLSPSISGSDRPIYVEVPFYRRNARKLTTDEIHDVASAALTIEHRLSFDAADVEWAFEGNILYILQARPYAVFAIRH